MTRMTVRIRRRVPGAHRVCRGSPAWRVLGLGTNKTLCCLMTAFFFDKIVSVVDL